MSPQSNQPNRATFTVDSKYNNMYEIPPVLSYSWSVNDVFDISLSCEDA